jgi:putative ABC transport system permease protein
MEASVSRSLARRQFVTQLLSAFGLVALTLAAVGAYGVMAYVVSQSMHEIGVRVALGASPNAIRALVLSRAVWPSSAGIVAGSAGSLVATRWLASLLFGVAAIDLVTVMSVAGILLAATLLASIVPLQRALAVEPAMIVH